MPKGKLRGRSNLFNEISFFLLKANKLFIRVKNDKLTPNFIPLNSHFRTIDTRDQIIDLRDSVQQDRKQLEE